MRKERSSGHDKRRGRRGCNVSLLLCMAACLAAPEAVRVQAITDMVGDVGRMPIGTVLAFFACDDILRGRFSKDSEASHFDFTGSSLYREAGQEVTFRFPVVHLTEAVKACLDGELLLPVVVGDSVGEMYMVDPGLSILPVRGNEEWVAKVLRLRCAPLSDLWHSELGAAAVEAALKRLGGPEGTPWDVAEYLVGLDDNRVDEECVNALITRLGREPEGFCGHAAHLEIRHEVPIRRRIYPCYIDEQWILGVLTERRSWPPEAILLNKSKRRYESIVRAAVVGLLVEREKRVSRR